MRFYLSVFLSFLLFKTASALTLQTCGPLPAGLTENSGLDWTGGTHFWTHVDGYGNNRLYRINSYGAWTRTVRIDGAINFDWEDLTHDASRTFMFIGDFGNNSCNRTNLKVYRIPYPSTVTDSVINAEAINFSYPDQTEFPSRWMNFDCESFVHFNNKLFLFSKPDSNAVGYVKLYSIPDEPGTYVATLIDSFFTNDRPTSVDVSQDGRSLVLLANSRLHLFRNWEGDNFFTGTYTLIRIPAPYSQKEAVTFFNNRTIYMTDEDRGQGNFLYSADLSSYIPTTTDITESDRLSLELSYNSSLLFYSVKNSSESFSLQLIDITGKTVMRQLLSSPQESISLNLMNGVYVAVLLNQRNEAVLTRRVVVY